MMEPGVIHPMVQREVTGDPFSNEDAIDEGVVGGSSE